MQVERQSHAGNISVKDDLESSIDNRGNNYCVWSHRATSHNRRERGRFGWAKELFCGMYRLKLPRIHDQLLNCALSCRGDMPLNLSSLEITRKSDHSQSGIAEETHS